jgi:Flp pilus assembly CpaF family ATPase
MAFMRLVQMVRLSGNSFARDDILEDLHMVIDIVIQLKRRIEGARTIREVSSIYYVDAIRA